MRGRSSGVNCSSRSHARRDDRQAVRHGLQDRERHLLVVRSQREHVHGVVVPRRVVDGTEPPHACGDAELFGQPAARRQQRTSTDDVQLGSSRMPGLRKRTQQPRDVLLGPRVRDTTHDQRCSGSLDARPMARQIDAVRHELDDCRVHTPRRRRFATQATTRHHDAVRLRQEPPSHPHATPRPAATFFGRHDFFVVHERHARPLRRMQRRLQAAVIAIVIWRGVGRISAGKRCAKSWRKRPTRCSWLCRKRLRASWRRSHGRTARSSRDVRFMGRARERGCPSHPHQTRGCRSCRALRILVILVIPAPMRGVLEGAGRDFPSERMARVARQPHAGACEAASAWYLPDGAIGAAHTRRYRAGVRIE
jgi:hypothetical protein